MVTGPAPRRVKIASLATYVPPLMELAKRIESSVVALDSGLECGNGLQAAPRT